MPYLPISPLSPEIPLAVPSGAAETRLGPIPNVPDGIPGIGGIGSVELPGIGVITGPANGGFGFPVPQLPSLTAPSPVVSPAPSATGTPNVSPLPEVTPYPTTIPQPSATPIPGPVPVPAPTATPGLTTVAPSPTTTPVPNTTTVTPLQEPGQGSPYSTAPITTTTIPNPIQTPFQPTTAVGIPTKETTAAATFGQYLKDAVSNYNQVQAQADNMIQRLATGDKVDIHDVTMAIQKAAITNQLAIQVRNRLVEAYQEVMRMQM